MQWLRQAAAGRQIDTEMAEAWPLSEPRRGACMHYGFAQPCRPGGDQIEATFLQAGLRGSGSDSAVSGNGSVSCAAVRTDLTRGPVAPPCQIQRRSGNVSDWGRVNSVRGLWEVCGKGSRGAAAIAVSAAGADDARLASCTWPHHGTRQTPSPVPRIPLPSPASLSRPPHPSPRRRLGALPRFVAQGCTGAALPRHCAALRARPRREPEGEAERWRDRHVQLGEPLIAALFPGSANCGRINSVHGQQQSSTALPAAF
eukprot:351236-Chlamydomonas_euryale.AAC.4